MENQVKIKSLIFEAVLFSSLGVNTVYAGNAENVEACVTKAKEFAGITLDEFDASYEGNWMDFSVAKWNNVVCEVKLGDVHSLKINDEYYIYQGFAGKTSYELNDSLEKRTGDAIDKMKSRISLLKDRMDKARKQLKSVNPDHIAIEDYINKGIKKAL
jgi:hypothetical protein